jgi:hypothetical protein
MRRWSGVAFAVGGWAVAVTFDALVADLGLALHVACFLFGFVGAEIDWRVRHE